MLQNTVEIQYPPEMALDLHLDADGIGSLIKETAAITLFRDGRITSGMAAAWLGLSRVQFLLKAMQDKSVSLLCNTNDEFTKETSLL